MYNKIRSATYTFMMEFFLMLVLGGWAVLLFAPWWDVFENSNSYNVLADILPEWAWGLIFGAVALTWFLGFVKNRIDIRAFCSLASSAIWVIVTVNFIFAGIIPTGTVVYGLMAIFSAICYLKINSIIKGI